LSRELAKVRFVVEIQAKLQASLLKTISEGADNEPGRARDRRGHRQARAENRYLGGLRGGGGGAGLDWHRQNVFIG
jgi:hypothetical protein